MNRQVLILLLVPLFLIVTAMTRQPEGTVPNTSVGPSILNIAITEPDSSLRCLALNLYRESGWETDEGQLAVATVTMNRVRASGFPASVCEVVYQRNPRGCQFSWVCQKTSPVDSVRYARSERIAARVLYGRARHPQLRRALYYHAEYVAPVWADNMTQILQIGAHIFYDPTPRQVEGEGKAEAANQADEQGPALGHDSTQNHGNLPHHPSIPDQG